jgi:outer membrane receptor protein involved in Fe transport
MRARAWVSVSSILALGFETLLLEALLASCPAWAEPADSQPLPPVTITAPTPPPAQTPVSRREPAPAPRRVARRPAPASRTVQTGPAVPSTQPAIPAEITRSDLSTAAAALPAASTTIDATTIYRRPYTTYGDIFRPVTGFNVSNYGQGAIGYGLSLRGYTEAEHGRDIAYFIDGVPVNEISSIHTPNYADLNILIPETVKSIEIVRGPFNVECGDSNLGGCVTITTKRSEPFASLGLSGGSWGTARAVATYSSMGGTFEPFFVQEGYRTDGYRDNSFVNRYDSFNKLSFLRNDGSVVSLRAQAYGTTFGAPGYISRDAVTSGALAPTAAVNRTDGGNKYLENVVANYASGTPDHELSGVLFASHDIFNRYADFGGGQRWQQDERTMIGGRTRKVWTGDAVLPVQLLAGTYWRTDFIDAFQGPTTARILRGPLTANLGINETNLAGYAQLQVKPAPWLKLTGAARYDQFYYDVTDKLTPANSTAISPGVWSPKAGVSVTPVKWLELYANYGQGFRSVDAALELIGNPGIRPFKIESKEAGIQLRFDRFTFLADYWTTNSENESFQAAPGLPVTFAGRAQRKGFDFEGRLYVFKSPANTVSLFANYSPVRALLLDSAPSLYVPNVPVYVANVGIDFDVATVHDQRLSGEAYVSFIGKKYLSQDGLLTTSPFRRVAGKLAYTWPDGWTVFGQATWYPGDRLSEFATNFGNVTGASSSDIFTSPAPGLTVMAGLTYRLPTPNFAPPPTSKMVVK